MQVKQENIHNDFTENQENTSWVENFFAIWQTAELRVKMSNYKLFLDPLIQEECYMNDDILSQIFDTENEREIQLTPYLINRIFLHGLMVHPEGWSDHFTVCFEQTLQLVSNKDSYSTELLQQLEYLKNYRVALIANKVFQNAETFFIPLPHLIQSTSQLKDVLSVLFPGNRLPFVEKLEGLFENLITDFRRLRWLLNLLPDESIISFIESLGSSGANLIENVNQLKVLLQLLPGKTRMPFIKSLGGASAFIENVGQLTELLKLLPRKTRMPFIKSLGGASAFIENVSQLTELLKLLPGKTRMPFVESLGRLDAKPIDDVTQLMDLLRLIPEDNRMPFIESLEEPDENFIKDIAQLSRLLALLPEDRKMQFIESPGGLSALRLIENADQLSELLELLPKECRMPLIESIEGRGAEFIENFNQLTKLLMILPEEGRILFIKSLEGRGAEFIENFNQLTRLLMILPKEGGTLFIESLEEKVENFIENFNQLRTLLWLLPEDNRMPFIERLEGKVENFIENFNQLTRLLKLLPEDNRMPFIESLGLEWLAANPIKDTKLVKLLRLLPEGDRLPFAERLAPPGKGRIFLIKVQIALAEVEIEAAEERANELRGFLFDKAFCDLEYLRKKVEKTPSILESDFEFIQNFIRATVQLCNNFNSEDNLNEYVNLKKEAAGKGSWGKIIGGLVLTTVSLLLMVAFITVAAASLGASTPLSAFGIAIATDLMIAGVAAIATGGAAVSAVSGGFLAKSGRDIGFFKLMDDTEKVYRQGPDAQENRDLWSSSESNSQDDWDPSLNL